MRSQVPFPSETCANIGGYTDSLSNEYALVGCSKGLAIVDVTDPAAPFKVKRIPGPNNLWKEVKTYRQYAYVTTEGGKGLQIVNLRFLPDSNNIPYKHWMPLIGTDSLKTIHALHIDTVTGFVYLYGSNRAGGGIVVADIKTDPWNPIYVGQYNQEYVHDGYVRNDTVYAGAIYAGHMRVIDFTNKNTPVILQTQSTPHNFTHNTWLSDDSKTVFTTDEKNDTYLTSYDVSDLSNISELDRIQSNPGSNSIVHNTHILNDYAVTSWYKDGFTIVDAHRPKNLVQVGNYDTYSGSGPGFEGAWGVYPYLPSGNILVSSMDGYLYVLTPDYKRACYLEGTVTDSITGLPINNALVEILTTSVTELSRLNGEYYTGNVDTGLFNVRYSKPGYVTKTITGISLSRANVTLQNVQLAPLPTFVCSGKVEETSSAAGVANAFVKLEGTILSYTATANGSGNFSLPAILADTYTITAGQWGFVTSCYTQTISSSTGALTIQLDSGYYDDFVFNFGWTVTGNATDGAWERGVPVGTNYSAIGDANPGVDANSDCGAYAYVTGNGGGAAGDDDIDNGYTQLTSPAFDLSNSNNPYLYYHRWFFNDGGSGSPNDSLVITLSNGTVDTIIEVAINTTLANSSWRGKFFRIKDYLTPTATMRVFIKANDANPGHLVEAGFDRFKIVDTTQYAGINNGFVEPSTALTVYPNPFTNSFTVNYNLSDNKSAINNLVIYDILGKEVWRKQLSTVSGSLQMNVELIKGIYFIYVQQDSHLSIPVKLVKYE